MAVKTSWAAGDVLLAADLTDTFAAKAPLASPTFTGTVALPATTTLNGATLTSGMKVVASATPSAASSVSFNSIFGTYTGLKLIISLTTISTAGYISLRWRASGSDTSTSTYEWVNMDVYSTTNAVGSGTTTQGYLSYSTAAPYYGSFDLISPASSANASFVGIGRTIDTSIKTTIRSCRCTQATAHDGFTIFNTGGGTFTGTIYVLAYA